MRNCCQFLWSVTKANPSVDNRFCSTPQKRCEYVLKISWKLEQSSIIRSESALKTSLQDVLKMSWRRLQNVSKASWRCLEDVLKTSWRCLEDVFARHLEDVLKTSWRCLEDVLKTPWRCLEDVFPILLEDVLKTYDQYEYIGLDQDVFWRRISIANMFVLKSLLKTKTKDVFKTSSSRRMFAGLPVKLFD